MGQYIGARYVPKFMGTYDATQAYENLCVVDNGQGTSYISQKPTPAGTPLTDTNYWAIYGTTSGAIINLQNQIGALSQLNTTTQNNLVDAINEVYDDVANIVTAKKHIVIIGDSWADEVNDSDVQMNTVLHNRFNATIHNYAYGGTGFDVPNGYDYQLTLMQADITNNAYARDDIMCVILMCGLNDHYGGATASVFASRLQDWYDKCIAIIGTSPHIPIYWFQNYSLENDINVTNKTTLLQQRNYYQSVINNVESDLIYVPMFGFIDGTQWKNDRHPNANGHKQLADNMVNVLNGEPPIMHKYQRIEAVINNPTLSSSDALVNIDYYVNFSGQELKTYIDVSAVALSTLSTSIYVNYSHTPTTNLTNCILPQDVLMADNTYIHFSITPYGSPTFTSSQGRYYIEVPNPLKDFVVI